MKHHPPARQQPYPLTPSAQTIIQEEKKILKKDQTSTNHVLLPYPALREIDLEPSPMIGSDKINRVRPEEKTQKKTCGIVLPGLTNENPALREVDLEPSAKRGTNGTAVLVSLY